MNTFRILALSLTFLAICSSSALGELRKCNGVWTNRPCDGKAEEVMAEATSAPRSQGAIELDRKKLWIHDLETKRYNAKQQYGIDVDISAERALCLESHSSLADCRKEIDAKMVLLDERADAALKQKVQETELKKPTAAEAPNITIINQHQENRILVERKATPTRKAGVYVGEGVDVGNIQETRNNPRGRH